MLYTRKPKLRRFGQIIGAISHGAWCDIGASAQVRGSDVAIRPHDEVYLLY